MKAQKQPKEQLTMFDILCQPKLTKREQTANRKALAKRDNEKQAKRDAIYNTMTALASQPQNFVDLVIEKDNDTEEFVINPKRLNNTKRTVTGEQANIFTNI